MTVNKKTKKKNQESENKIDSYFSNIEDFANDLKVKETELIDIKEKVQTMHSENEIGYEIINLRKNLFSNIVKFEEAKEKFLELSSSIESRKGEIQDLFENETQALEKLEAIEEKANQAQSIEADLVKAVREQQNYIKNLAYQIEENIDHLSKTNQHITELKSTRITLDASINEKFQAVQIYDEEIGLLESHCKKVTETIEQLNKQLTELEIRENFLLRQRETLLKTVSTNDTEVNKLTNSIESHQTNIKELRCEIKLQDDLLYQLENEKIILDKEREVLEKEISLLEHEFSVNKKQVIETTSSHTDLKQKVESYSRIKEKLTRDIVSSKAVINQNQTSATELTQLIEVGRLELTSLQDEYKQRQAELLSSKKELVKVNNQSTSLNQKRSQVNRDISLLEEDFRKHEEVLFGITEETQQIQKELASFEVRRKDLNIKIDLKQREIAKIEDLKNDLSHQVIENEKLAKIINEENLQLKGLRDKRAQIESHIYDERQALSKAEAELEKAKQDGYGLTSKLTFLNKDLRRLQSNRAEILSNIKTLEKEVIDVKAEVARRETERNSLSTEVSNKQGEIQNLKAYKNREISNRDKVEREIALLNSEQFVIDREISELEAYNDSLVRSKLKLEHEKNSINDQLVASKQQNEILSQQRKQLLNEKEILLDSIEEGEEEVASLILTTQELKRKISVLEFDKSNISANLDETKKEVKKARDSYNEAKGEYGFLEGTVAELESLNNNENEKLEKITLQNSLISKVNVNLNEKFETAVEESFRLGKSLYDNEIEHHRLSEEIKELHSIIETNESIYQQKSERLEALNNEVKALEYESRRQREASQDLSHSLDEKSNEIKLVIQARRDLAKEIDALIQKNEKDTHRLNKLRLSFIELQNQRDLAKTQLNDLEVSANFIEEENQKLEKKIQAEQDILDYTKTETDELFEKELRLEEALKEGTLELEELKKKNKLSERERNLTLERINRLETELAYQRESFNNMVSQKIENDENSERLERIIHYYNAKIEQTSFRSGDMDRNTLMEYKAVHVSELEELEIFLRERCSKLTCHTSLTLNIKNAELVKKSYLLLNQYMKKFDSISSLKIFDGRNGGFSVGIEGKIADRNTIASLESMSGRSRRHNMSKGAIRGFSIKETKNSDMLATFMITPTRDSVQSYM